MSITRHPSAATLAAFATGTLDRGRSVVVATHLELCRTCRDGARAFECIGGAALDAAVPMPMLTDAPLATLDAIPQIAAKRTARPVASAESPAALASYKHGAWRWIGPGIYLKPVDVPSEGGTRVFMLKAAPGTVLPHHKHTGAEWTCILQGAFRHGDGRFGVGDFDEADESDEHHPVVEDGSECICLVALQGEVRFQGWIGRMLQPFVRL